MTLPDYGYGGYRPGALLPGGTEPRPQHVGRPAPTHTSGAVVNAIELRWRAIMAASPNFQQPLQDFLGIDVPRLLAIASAASALGDATNLEASRQASQNLTRALGR